jgi:GMP synthase-like glutamine amidotransferase
MKKILVVQSRRTPKKIEAEMGRFERAVDGEAELGFVSSVDMSQSWNKPEKIVTGYDAVFFGGSSDFFFDGGRELENPERAGTFEVLERVRPLIAHLLENQIPTLGICLGHQLVSEAFGGKVTHDHQQRKMGTYPVFRTAAGKNDRFFSQLADTFPAQYAHRDSVTSLPMEATLLADGPACKFSALRFGEAFYTMQFHPELTAGDLAENAEAITEYLKEGQTIEDVIEESPVASSIIPTFLRRVI